MPTSSRNRAKPSFGSGTDSLDDRIVADRSKVVETGIKFDASTGLLFDESISTDLQSADSYSIFDTTTNNSDTYLARDAINRADVPGNAESEGLTEAFLRSVRDLKARASPEVCARAMGMAAAILEGRGGRSDARERNVVARDSGANKFDANGLDELDRELAEKVKKTWLRDGIGKTTPARFIRENYDSWLDNPRFTRGHITRRDFALSQAYASHIRSERHPEDDLKLRIEPRGSRPRRFKKHEGSRQMQAAAAAREYRARRKGAAGVPKP
ncbi:MAG: hypothetical protein ABSC25_08705 [Roseiarcus sp.]|jgi:hypothetical protein